MSTIVDHWEVASRRTGEIYKLTFYNDGTATCTCKFGEMNGPMKADGRTCRHFKAYHAERRGENVEEILTTPRPKPKGLDREEWLMRFAAVFCPHHYMHNVLKETIRLDDEEWKKKEEKDQLRVEQGRLRRLKLPIPRLPSTRIRTLPEANRAVLDKLLKVMEDMIGTSARPSRSEGNQENRFAYQFMRQALYVRENYDYEENTDLALRLHKWSRKEL